MPFLEAELFGAQNVQSCMMVSYSKLHERSKTFDAADRRLMSLSLTTRDLSFPDLGTTMTEVVRHIMESRTIRNTR